MCELNEYILVLLQNNFPFFPAPYVYINIVEPSGSFTYHQV